ncbi:MAG: hypothetical protein ACPL6D_04250 [Thermodesulfobacteriota bacterium]
MNYIKQFMLINLVLAMMFFGVHNGLAQPKPLTNPPIITHSFAVEKGHFGTVWRVYLSAEDPDGDMLKIAITVDQLGYGHYPTDWIYLKPIHQKQFKGYLQWNTFSSKTHFLREWTQITINISIFDKTGNESNIVIFPFEFTSGKPQLANPPAPFDQGDIPRLGHITIDLYETEIMGGDGNMI